MLRIIFGKAGTGKTGRIINEIAEHVRCGSGRDMLIVPEQYSHEAEREMCLACGDRMSLTAEVFSFTGLARRVMSELGGEARKYLDKGGRTLCMALALDNCTSRLRLYSAGRKTELQQTLLAAVDELKSACVNEEQLRRAAEETAGGLRSKLLDLALILETYNAVAGRSGLDPADRLTILAQQIPESGINSETRVYIDGFIDFTGQELKIIKALLKKDAEVVICLTLDSCDSENEMFASARRTVLQLLAYAKENGVAVCVEDTNDEQAAKRTASELAENMFSYSNVQFEAPENAVRLFHTGSVSEECELAAGECIRLVRDKGCRWRDISIAVRGFDDYRAALESCFSHYGVPLYTARKSELVSKPLPAFISAVYELTGTGWDVDDFIALLHTGLTGLDTEDADLLEKYVFTWQLREGAWKRNSDWHQSPDGYAEEEGDEADLRLERINRARRQIAGPLLTFEQNARSAHTAAEQAQALADYFEQCRLPQTLAERAEKLKSEGRETLADEYMQLWELCVSALEQCASILGTMETDMQTFGKLYLTVLSQYSVGTIPVSLDRVTAGDFDRMRRRSIRHLIVLGCTDSRIPMAENGGGTFTGEERRQLLELDIDLGGGHEQDIYHEFSLIYNCFTLPSESITLCRPLSDSEGNGLRPSIVFKRAGAIFGITETKADMDAVRMSAKAPALTLAACSVYGKTPERLAAAEYFKQNDPETFEKITAAANAGRGSLSAEAVTALYGHRLKLSASKIDKLAACRFEYFCRYGMRAKEYEPAGFKPPEVGTFIHYVLEITAKKVKEAGGWSAVDDDMVRSIVDQCIGDYINEKLRGFEEKTPRFVHLFNRLRAEVHTIVNDMAEELRRSDFEPVEFEFDFAAAGTGAKSLKLPESFGDVQLTGIADRIDTCERNGKLYLRVVDYKSGHKKFSFDDIRYGTGLQMLLYLYTLCENNNLFGEKELIPAGVMYVPVKEGMVKGSSSMSDEDIYEERIKALRRSGLVLNDDDIIEAWEHGEDKMFIPIKKTKNGFSGDGLVTGEQFKLLYRHIVRTLGELSSELIGGNISASPLYTNETDNECRKCPFRDGCGFSDGENGENVRIKKKMSTEDFWTMMEGDGEDV